MVRIDRGTGCSSVGADDGTRTRNRRFTKPLLYQLSYVGGDELGYRRPDRCCKHPLSARPGSAAVSVAHPARGVAGSEPGSRGRQDGRQAGPPDDDGDAGCRTAKPGRRPDAVVAPRCGTLRAMHVTIPGIERPYAWQEGWGDVPPPHDPAAWAHPGLAAAPDGSVLVVDADQPLAHVLAPEGALVRSFPLPVTEGHGLHLDLLGDRAALWVADPGFKLRGRGPQSVREGPEHGRVLRLDLAGNVLLEIGTPPHPAYAERPFKPTGIAISGPPHDRTLWIADGYGAHLVHRFRQDGTWLSAIGGGGEGLSFQTPHAVFLDDRSAEPEILVTDRVGRRLQAFDLDGAFRRTLADGEVTSPSALARLGDLLLVAELRASVAVLDPDGRVIGRIGDRPAAMDEPDWPNARDAAGDLVRSGRIAAGGFHAPHGLAVGIDGSIHVAEFVLGGRMIRLAPA
jgi:hypothetical protein